MSKEHCCCGCIHAGALIISYLVLNLGIIGLLISVVTGLSLSIVGIMGVYRVIVGGCIIYADKYHKSRGYLPYLIFSAIGIIIDTICIVFFVIMAIFVPETLLNYIQTYVYETLHKEIDPKTATSVMFFVMAAMMAFADWIAIWFWIVIYRAYQHMNGVEEDDREQTYQAKLNNV